MPFAKRHDEIIKKVGMVSPFRLWLNTVIFAWFVFGLCIGYLYLRASNGLSTFNVNQAAANTSVFLMGLSFLLSSISYFWDFADTKIIYRKHLGVVGFSFAIAHIVFVTVVMQDRFPLSSWLDRNLDTFILGLIATVIFTLMTAISNQYAATQLGGKTWRGILRYGGYSAMIFVLAHMFVAGGARWFTWFDGYEGLPPLGLIGMAFIGLVVIARIILAVALWRNKDSAPAEPTSQV
jgi:DMSO/TMAO reductase YedYZ heme-binding membrane subunit